MDNIEIQVPKGELFGLIGPDGAGKTTLFRILATLMLPDAGQSSIGGKDVIKDFLAIRRMIGYMPGKFSLYQDLSVWENLEFYATVFGGTVAENYEQIKPIYSQIEPFKSRRAGQLSGGMKQKLALCCALVHRPEVLILDEPTTGVDPVSRKEFWDMLQLLKGEGLTIIVSTPYMDEANRCDRIALVQNGQIMDTNTPANIIANYPKTLLAVSGAQMFPLLNAIRHWPATESCYAFGESHHVSLREGIKAAHLKAYLIGKGFLDVFIEEIKPNIEDVFMDFLNKKKTTV